MSVSKSTRSVRKKYKYPDEQKIFGHILGRCYRKQVAGYSEYGGRGIAICERWLSGGWKVFAADVGNRLSSNHSIDRIDNDGGYWCGKAECPECGPLGRLPNCRWATAKEQAYNRRTNRRIEWRGETLTLTEWANRLGIDYRTLAGRLRSGWSLDRAMTPTLASSPIPPETIRAVLACKGGTDGATAIGKRFGLQRETVRHIWSRYGGEHL